MNISALAGRVITFMQNTWQRLITDDAIDLPQWRERIIMAVFGAVMVFGLVPLYFSLKMAIATQLWLNGAIYLGVYILVCVVAFVRAIPLTVRAWLGVGMLFLLGAFAFFTLGPHSSGRIYIFSAAILASLLLGLRSSLGFLFFVIIFSATFTYFLNTGAIRWRLLQQDPVTSWNTAIITFLFLCVIICAALAVLIKGLSSALQKSREYSHRLSEVGDTLRQEMERQSQLQAGLAESEKRFKDLFESAPNAYFTLKMDGRIQRCNRQAARLLACPATDVAGRSILEFFADNAHGQSKAGNILERLKQGREVADKELQMVRGNGERIWVNLTVSTVRDANGDFTEWRAIVVDITERKRIAQALTESEQRFRQIFEESPVPLLMQDFSEVKKRLQDLVDSGVGDLNDYLEQHPEEFRTLISKIKITFLNQATLDLYQAEDREELASKLVEPPSKEAGRYFRYQMVEFFNGRKRFEKARLEKTFQGNEIDVVINKVVMAGYEEDLSSVLTSIIDLSAVKTAQREKEKLESQLRQSQKMEAIGTLAGGIAHDFNNILGVMTGYAELALASAREKRSPVPDIEELLNTGDRARDLVQQILTFSHKVEVDMTPVDLNQEIRRTVNLLGRTLPKMINIETILADDLPPILANTHQLEQILLNLATNAQQAMPEGGRLAIETQAIALDDDYCTRHLECKPGQYVLLQVSDNGCGMDESTREHIFDPFFTTKGVGKGTGLGLSTVFGIVKGFGGRVLCYSEPGIGTTFKVYLPTFDQKAPPRISRPALAREYAGGHESILLVDDEEALCAIGSRLLAGVGYQVLTAESGERALQLYQDQGGEIDLVVMDLSMPGMGGYKAMKAILEIDPSAKIIIASGYAVNGSVKEALQSGAAGYVAKPFHAQELMATVRGVLDGE